MKVLAIESSTHEASCALSVDGVVREQRLDASRPSSETLLPGVQQLLAEAGVSLVQLDGIVFGAGPGAFTGIRVAVGVTQGLAFAHDLPVAGVETLAALAYEAHAQAVSGPADADSGWVLAALDARMGEIYVARYRVDATDVARVGEIEVLRPEHWVMPAVSDDWMLCGNAVTANPLFAERVVSMRRAPDVLLPRAAAVAVLGVRALERGEGGAAETAMPLYVRDKVALTVAERLAQGGRA